MKIITWNCNLNLIKKFEHIEKLRPDIVILQECEKLDQNYFPNSKYFWIGKNEKKDWVFLFLILLLKLTKVSIKI